VAVLNIKINEVKFWELVRKILLQIKNDADEVLDWSGVLAMIGEKVDGVAIDASVDKLLKKVNALIEEARKEELEND